MCSQKTAHDNKPDRCVCFPSQSRQGALSIATARHRGRLSLVGSCSGGCAGVAPSLAAWRKKGPQATDVISARSRSARTVFARANARANAVATNEWVGHIYRWPAAAWQTRREGPKQSADKKLENATLDAMRQARSRTNKFALSRFRKVCSKSKSGFDREQANRLVVGRHRPAQSRMRLLRLP